MKTKFSQSSTNYNGYLEFFFPIIIFENYRVNFLLSIIRLELLQLKIYFNNFSRIYSELNYCPIISDKNSCADSMRQC